MTLKDQLLENTDVLVSAIEDFPDSTFNTKPDQDFWSAADVLEHLYRSEFGLPRLFVGETKTLTDRTPDALVEGMKQRFLESDTKMTASGVILPTSGEKSKQELVATFRKNRERIAQLLDEYPPEELCLKFKHPIFGHLTRMEWVHFNIIHTQRHMRQLARIKEQLL